MAKIKLRDVKFTRIWENGEAQDLTLENSPYYVAISAGGAFGHAVYDFYNTRLNRLFPEDEPGLDYSGFLHLLSDMRTNGLRQTQDPIRVVDGVVFDGLHRLSIMLYLYGTEQEIEVEDGQVVGLA
jgi:hypothetical protein